MFDIGWTELVIIGVVALIVIGPKDLPEMFRTLGRFTGKLRSMARDFQRAMDDAANQSGVKDVAKDLKGMTSPKSLGLDAVKDAAAKFEKWDPLKPAPKPAPKPAVAAPATSAPTSAPPPAPALGPATQALADKAAARKTIAAEAAAKLRAVGEEGATTAAPTAAAPKPARARAPGRVRTPAKPAKTAAAATAPAAAAKPAPKPRKKADPAP